MKRFVISEIEIGQKASITQEITEGNILIFAGATGDLNPVHINEDFAEKTKFTTRIAHGMLSVSLIAAVLGRKLPGEGSVYVSQDVKFKAPVFIGDIITAEVEVIAKDIERNRITLNTTCMNQSGQIVIEGQAVSMPIKQ